jgi:hypothetical protein
MLGENSDAAGTCWICHKPAYEIRGVPICFRCQVIWRIFFCQICGKIDIRIGDYRGYVCTQCLIDHYKE